MKLLLLLTHSFPCDTGEEFLSHEVGSIAGFDRVLVCPCNLKPESRQTRALPETVECRPTVRRKAGRVQYARILAMPCVYGEIFFLLRSGNFTPARIRQMLFFLKNALEIEEALEKMDALRQADEITVCSYWFYDAAAAGVFLAKKLRRSGKHVVLISRAHGFDIHPERAPLGYLPMRRFLLQNVDRLYPCSQNGADCIQREFPVFAEKIRVSYLGTPDRGLKPGSRREFHLVSCSYMVPVKRLHLIVQALQKAEFPVLWTHLGTGPLEPEIRSLARNLGPNVRAEFPGGMENESVLEYYRSHDLTAFLNVSSSEGIPVSVMEACSFGLPVVATDVGGTGEIVSDGENGFLLPKNFSPEDLLDRLHCLREMSEAEYGRMCDASRAVWEEKFNAEKNYRNFYGELIR